MQAYSQKQLGQLLSNSNSATLLQILDHIQSQVPDKESSSEMNMKVLLKKKSIHSFAAISYFESVQERVKGIRDLSRDSIYLISLFELIEVDFADSLGELTELREYDSQFNLFVGLKKRALYNQNYTLFRSKNTRKEWNELLENLCYEFYEIFKKYQSSRTTQHIDQRLSEYYHMVLNDHLKGGEANEVKSTLMKIFDGTQQSSKSPPNWVTNFNLWTNFLGDSIGFLVPLYVLTEIDSNKKDLLTKQLLHAFRDVGLLNVLLDDIIDIDEDISRGDGNLIVDIETNRYKDQFSKLIQEHSSRDEYSLGNILKSLITSIRGRFSELALDLPLKERRVFEAFFGIETIMTRWYLNMAIEQNVNAMYIDYLKESIETDV